MSRELVRELRYVEVECQHQPCTPQPTNHRRKLILSTASLVCDLRPTDSSLNQIVAEMTFFQIASQKNHNSQSLVGASKKKGTGSVRACEPLQVMTKLFAQQNLHDIPATTLTQIPSQEREESMYDIHGVKALAVEDPEFVQARSQALMQALVDLKNRNKSRPEAYEWVLENAREFMTQQVVKALRAESFDIEKAAKRLQSHFQMKLEYFGPFCLGRELELQDLGPEERDLLQQGGKQLLPVRDRSGRGICIGFPAANSRFSPECKVWYADGWKGNKKVW